MKKPLTKKQHQTLEFLENFYYNKGYMPSIVEIGKKFNGAISSIHQRLEYLQSKGWIKRNKGKPRWIVFK